ncbi:unnamed protein product, partial [Rotaria sp. Silwood1]
KLPPSIISLSHLRILKLGHNHLCSLPRSFGSLKSLEILDLTGNDLNEDSLTNDFFQLSNIYIFESVAQVLRHSLFCI